MENRDDYMEIDFLRLMHALGRKVWAIILVALIFGGCALSYTMFYVSPLYKARTLLYVNNNSFSLGDTKLSISQGELTAAQSLVDTYSVVLKTRTTLEEVIDQAGLPYTYEQLENMVSAASVNSTEIFRIEVTSTNPQEAELIANTIGQVLPEKIASIVEESSVRIVDTAVIPARRSSPNLIKNTVMGLLLGAVLACGLIIVVELRDHQIHDSDYLLQSYDIPILAVIPNLMITDKRGGYYQKND